MTLLLRVIIHPTIWICSTTAAIMLDQPSIMLVAALGSAAIEGEVSKLMNGN